MSVVQLKTMDKDQLKSYFNSYMEVYGEYVGNDFEPNIQYGADIYKVTYCTSDFDNSPTVASGVISIPFAAEGQELPSLPTVSYEHGTSVTHFDTVSNLNVEDTFDGPTPLVFFTGSGYIYIAADYLAFGESTLPRHRYFHARTEARSTADLLRASKHVSALQNANKNNKLFLFGFSQGGHVSMALQRALEKNHGHVTAQATIGGVYDPEAWLLKSVFDPEGETPEYISLYISFLTLAYNDVYGIYNDINEVFQPYYAGIVEGLFDMEHIFDDVAFSLPPDSQSLLTPEWRISLANNPTLEFLIRLRQNEVYKWRPKSPIRFFHSTEDDEVDYKLARKVFYHMKVRGAPISFQTMEGYNHLSSWHHAMPLVIDWFNTF